MAGITVKKVVITGNKIAFTLPKGNVLSKISGTFSMPQSFTFTVRITPEEESSNGHWFPITRDFNLPEGQRPVAEGGNQISHARIYAKVGKIIGRNKQGHNLFSISKLGFVALNINKYIEDFECDDGTLETAMSKLVGENLGNGTGVIKLKESSEDSGTIRNPDIRVTKMQQALNAAGYVDMEGKKLNPDGRLGDRTRFAAKQAGINPDTWNGTPAITPKPNAIQGMPSNFSSDANNVKILQQYLVRMGEQKNIATTKVPSGIDGIYGRRTEAATKRVMESQKLTWDQLWAQAVQYAKQMSGQDNHMARVDKTTAQVNPEAAEFANPQKLTAQTQGVTQQAQPVSAAQYAANASNVLQPKQAVAESVENKDKETVEEIKNTFYDIFNRMNNATILQ